jgi:hypothetical protein
MPRQENSREDILAEATALVERAECTAADEAEPIVVGFRSGGAASIYFGQDAAYHFDSERRLRRAYLGGLLYKADRGRLASLQRRRTGVEVQLVRHDLSDSELAAFLDEMQGRIERLKTAARSANVHWLRQVTEDGVSGKIVAWLAELPGRIEIAQTARVR